MLTFYTGVAYTKLEAKHCYGVRYGRYATIEAAQNACTIDINCQGVYDFDCDAGAYDIYLCPKTAAYQTSSSSCIYQKGKFDYLLSQNTILIQNDLIQT